MPVAPSTTQEHPTDAMSSARRPSGTAAGAATPPAAGTAASPTSDIPGDENVRPTVREAFRAAVAQHAAAAAGSPPAGTGEATDTGTPAAATTTPAPSPALSEPAVLTEAEFATLQQTHQDPVILLKELNKAWTQKTQKLAAERKALEGVEAYRGFIEDYEADPEGTVAALAQAHGLQVTKSTDIPKPGSSVAPATTTTTPAPDLMAQFREDLGAEYGYLAEAFAPAIERLVERVTATKVQPIEQRQTLRERREAEQEVSTTLASFQAKHPDFATHEPAMLRLMEKIPPAPNLPPLDYLELIYGVATRQAWEADRETHIGEAVKQAMGRMQTTAAETAPRSQAVPAGSVVTRPPGVPTFRDAAAAAMRGERWEE